MQVKGTGGSYAVKLAMWVQASPLLTRQDEVPGGSLVGPWGFIAMQVRTSPPPPGCPSPLPTLFLETGTQSPLPRPLSGTQPLGSRAGRRQMLLAKAEGGLDGCDPGFFSKPTPALRDGTSRSPRAAPLPPAPAMSSLQSWEGGAGS